MIEDIMEMVQSDEIREVMDLRWTAVINVSAIRDAITSGSGGDGPPSFLKKLSFKHTWSSQKYQNSDINCAAFALCNFLSDRGEYSQRVNFSEVGRIARERSFDLQTRLGWGSVVTLDQLQDFINLFPAYKLLVFVPNRRSPEATFFKEFVGSCHQDSNKECTIVYFDNHWALTASIQGFVNQMKPGGNFTFCKECRKVLANPTRLRLEELPCHSVEPPKKKRKQAKVCKAPQCNGHVHGDEKCPFTVCPACSIANNDPSHRCCLLPRTFGKPPPQETFWNDELDDYAFCTDGNGDGSVPAFFAYDIETAVHTKTISPMNPRNLVKPPLDENYGYSLEGFDEIAKMYLADITDDNSDIVDSLGLSSEYNQLVPNLIVCTNIYGSKIPKNAGDPMYEPEMIRFSGPNCVREFIEYATSYNNGNFF